MIHRTTCIAALSFAPLASLTLGTAPGCRTSGHRDTTISHDAEATSHDAMAISHDATAISHDGPARFHDAEASCLRVRRRAGDTEWRWNIVDVSVDLDECTLDVARARDGDRLEHLLPPGALAVLNGGYFQADFRPTAWLRSRDVDLSPVRRTHAGGVLAVRSASVFIGPLAELPFDPEFAVQNGPLLVETDGAVGIHGDDGKRAARTIACSSAGAVRFVVMSAPAGDGPTLLEAARWLSGHAGDGGRCGVALNLDGGPSTGIVFAPEIGEDSVLPRAPIGYGIVIQPAASRWPAAP